MSTVSSLAALLLVTASALPSSSPLSLEPRAVPDPAGPRAYLSAALDLMQQRSLKRDSVDWPKLRAEATAKAIDARTTADTYDAIRFALRQLGDRHSLFMTPEAREAFELRTVESNPKPRVEALAPGIGYVALQGLGMINPAETTRFASDLQQRIASIDSERSGTCGWVVDLRRNRGGNMWPMIAGLGPILGEGKVGAFVYPEGTEVPWTYKAGVASEGDLRRVSAIEAAYVLRRGDGAVAVLTGRATGSSGEAVVVAFRGRPHTRSFGGQTAGLSTSNSAFRLSDGAMLLLTTAWFADRLGTTYGGIIEPDAVLDSAGAEHSAGASEPPDTVIAAALSWLLDQKSCRDGR